MIVPQPIRAVLSRSPRLSSVGIRMPILRGQICVTHGHQSADRAQRLVLVLGVDERREFAEIMFVHPYTELATGTDLVVPTERSSVAYQVVVETDVRGVIWSTQLGPLIGVLERTALEAVGAVALGEHPAQPDLVSGLPLRGRFDRRWDFKAAEGSALRILAAECTASLLGGQDPLQLDVGVLAPALLATCGDPESAMLKLMDIISKGDVVFDFNDVQLLNDIGALRVANWTDVFGDIGHDFFMSVQPLAERALSMGPAASDPSDETTSAWAEERKAEAGKFRPRFGCTFVSAAYVRAADRQSSLEVADSLNIPLIDRPSQDIRFAA